MRQTVELILRGGPIWTGGPRPRVAQAAAVGGGRLLAVGTEAEVEELRTGSTRTIELDGRLVVPGFVDAHVHFLMGGFDLMGVRLRGAADRADLAQRIGAAARALLPGSWVLGGGWDHEVWGGTLPHREWIDPVTPDHPVMVHRLDQHTALVNTKALEVAGIAADVADPAGGSFERDPSTGALTGILRDEAIALVAPAVPPPRADERDRAWEKAATHALSLGVTQVHDMGSWSDPRGWEAWEDLAAHERARERGCPGPRVYAVVPLSTWPRLRERMDERGRGDDRLWWGGGKAFVDGSLGSATAWFHEPYADAAPGTPHDRGFPVTDLEELAERIRRADAAGIQPIVHAIGDRAVDWLIGVYGGLPETAGPGPRRPRVEHAQHLAPGAAARASAARATASMQPVHLLDDGGWLERRLGRGRGERSYAVASLIGEGAPVAFGSDWTVAPLDPLVGLRAACGRRPTGHPGALAPDQRVSPERALQCYTWEGARAAFVEDRTGRISPGMYADLAVLSDDVRAMPAEEIEGVRVDLTMVEGAVVFQREE